MPLISYAGQRIALLTQHGKERVIAPVLDPVLHCRIERIDGYDTDQLGTFTRDIPRVGTQIETARKKARIGMELSGLPLGLASEGAFGPDPMTGVFPWNVECLVLIDDINDLEIVGIAQGATQQGHLLASNWAATEAFARKMDFPTQHLVVRPDDINSPRFRKGIACWQELEKAFQWAVAESVTNQVFLEVDLRACCNPPRMAMIRQAAEDLLARLQCNCPACGIPGFALIERTPGLPCKECDAPTHEYRAEVFGCLKCGHRLTKKRIEPEFADPGRCPLCNP